MTTGPSCRSGTECHAFAAPRREVRSCTGLARRYSVVGVRPAIAKLACRPTARKPVAPRPGTIAWPVSARPRGRSSSWTGRSTAIDRGGPPEPAPPRTSAGRKASHIRRTPQSTLQTARPVRGADRSLRRDDYGQITDPVRCRSRRAHTVLMIDDERPDQRKAYTPPWFRFPSDPDRQPTPPKACFIVSLSAAFAS